MKSRALFGQWHERLVFYWLAQPLWPVTGQWGRSKKQAGDGRATAGIRAKRHVVVLAYVFCTHHQFIEVRQQKCCRMSNFSCLYWESRWESLIPVHCKRSFTTTVLASRLSAAPLSESRVFSQTIGYVTKTNSQYSLFVENTERKRLRDTIFHVVCSTLRL